MPDPVIALPDVRLTVPEVIALHAEGLDRSKSMGELRAGLEARSVAARRDLFEFDLPMLGEAEALVGLMQGHVDPVGVEQRQARAQLLDLGRRLRERLEHPGEVVDVETLLNRAFDTDVPPALVSVALARLMPQAGEAMRAVTYLRDRGLALIACALLWLPLSTLAASGELLELLELPQMERGWGLRDETDPFFFDR